MRYRITWETDCKLPQAQLQELVKEVLVENDGNLLDLLTDECTNSVIRVEPTNGN